VVRVSTVGYFYYAIKQCLIGCSTERGQSRCSVCAVTMPNCSADKGLKAVNDDYKCTAVSCNKLNQTDVLLHHLLILVINFTW